MCGRFVQNIPFEALKQHFNISTSSSDIVPKHFAISEQYPYYSPKLALNVYAVSAKVVQAKDVAKALKIMMDNETFFYQATLQSLAPRQIALLRALVLEPSKTILSNRYIH